MLTKKEVLEAAMRGEGCLGKAADDEPVFVLRAQDATADDCVERWAIMARTLGSTNTDKLLEAGHIAEAMRLWPNRKIPD